MKWPWSKKNNQPNLRDIKERRKLVKAMPSRGDLNVRAKQLGGNRRKQLWRERWEGVVSFLQKNFKYFAFPLLFVILAVGAFGFRKVLEATDYFSINDIRVLGSEQLDNTEITDFLLRYQNVSMIGLNADSIAADIEANFSYVRKAYVNKFLPDTLEVEIQERYPQFAYVNLAGAYLVDEFGEIITVVDQEEEEPAGYDEEELAIINGYVDLNSSRVRQRYYQKWESVTRIEKATELEIDPEDVPEPKWGKVKNDKKLEIASELQQEYRVGLQTRLDKHQEAIANLELGDLPILTDVETRLLAEFDTLAADQLDFLAAAQAFELQYNLKITQIEWLSSYNIQLKIGSGTRFLFTATKPFSTQFDMINAINKVERLRKLNQVDLRGELVAVK